MNLDFNSITKTVIPNLEGSLKLKITSNIFDFLNIFSNIQNISLKKQNQLKSHLMNKLVHLLLIIWNLNISEILRTLFCNAFLSNLVTKDRMRRLGVH